VLRANLLGLNTALVDTVSNHKRIGGQGCAQIPLEEFY
jgi:hypothetical protein